MKFSPPRGGGWGGFPGIPGQHPEPRLISRRMANKRRKNRAERIGEMNVNKKKDIKKKGVGRVKDSRKSLSLKNMRARHVF